MSTDTATREFSPVSKELGDKIAGLTLKEAKELSDYLEDVHGIKAAAGGGVMMAGPMESVFAGAPAALRAGFEDQMGVVFRFGGQALPAIASLLILAGTAVVFYLLSILRFSHKSR